jgi:hypothetical protein
MPHLRHIFPVTQPGAHNGAVTNPQVGAVCPQCGSAAAVHSIEELAAFARTQLGQQGFATPPQQGYAAQPQPGPPGAPQPGFGGTPQPGFGGAPQPGAPQPGFGGGPQPGSPQPGFDGAPQPGFGGAPQPGAPQPGAAGPGPTPGWAGQPRPGPPGGWRGTRSRMSDSGSGGDGSLLDAVGDDLAGVALTAATKFIGRAIGRRVQRTMNERVLPAMAARQQEMLQTQLAIAERHPDLRACLNDKVVFLAGGSRVAPMPNLGGQLTVEQADALVAGLRNG